MCSMNVIKYCDVIFFCHIALYYYEYEEMDQYTTVSLLPMASVIIHIIAVAMMLCLMQTDFYEVKLFRRTLKKIFFNRNKVK